MRLSEVIPGTGDSVAVDSASLRAWLADRYQPPRPDFVRLNLVTSLTGSATGSDGTSDTLTSRTDRTVLSVIRSLADVVVVGARSVRAEGYVVPSRARLAVISRSGDLTGHRLSPSDADRVLLITPTGVVPRDLPPAVEHVTVGDSVTPAGIVAALRDRRLSGIVCEGGPNLASQFARAGVVDEVCVTVAPALTPAPSPWLSLEAPLRATPVGLLADEAGFSFLRLALS